MKPEYVKYIIKSINQHCQSRLPVDARIFYTGQFMPELSGTRYEIRISGPAYKALGKNNEYIYVELNILCTAALNAEMYVLEYMLGEATKCMTDVIHVTDDDGVFLFCLELMQSRRRDDRVQVRRFGQIDSAVPVLQGSVEGHYDTTISRSQ